MHRGTREWRRLATSSMHMSIRRDLSSRWANWGSRGSAACWTRSPRLGEAALPTNYCNRTFSLDCFVTRKRSLFQPCCGSRVKMLFHKFLFLRFAAFWLFCECKENKRAIRVFMVEILCGKEKKRTRLYWGVYVYGYELWIGFEQFIALFMRRVRHGPRSPYLEFRA